MTSPGSDRSRADFLGAVPILAGLSEELRAEIGSRSTTLQLRAGAWLFRQGEPGDSLYVVCSGCLEAVVETPEQAIVRVLRRGAIVGELALLTESTRSASVRARRDSELLELTRSDFADLLAREPEFTLALTRELGRRLQASRALGSLESGIPATITLVPLDSAQPLRTIRDGLVAALRQWGPVALLQGREREDDPSSYGPLLDRAEREHRQVLLVAGEPAEDDPWTAFCLRQSDRVLCLVGAGKIPPSLERYPKLQGCDLLLHQSGARSTEIGGFLDALRPRATHLLREGPAFAGDLSRAARRLAGRSVGLVLSGGGARGLAHLGVLEELVASELEIDRVGGCSMGAFVGAMFASEQPPEAIYARCREEFVLRNPLGDYTVPLVSLLRGTRARAMLVRTFGSSTIEELPRGFFCVSCDLLSGELIVHRHGRLLEAVGASMSLPGVFAPLARGGRLLVDGGVLNNLPVEPMAAMAEGPVIAVDVTARFLPPRPRAGERPRARQWASRARRAVVGVETPLPRLKDTLARAIGIGSVDAVETARRRADLLITPETGVVGLLEFDQLDRMVEIGRQAARAALEAVPGFPDR
jgi:NTE family protein